MSVFLEVVSVDGQTARMRDGRIVRLGTLTDVAVGDQLEVYADIALSKQDAVDVLSVVRSREEVGV